MALVADHHDVAWISGGAQFERHTRTREAGADDDGP